MNIKKRFAVCLSITFANFLAIDSAKASELKLDIYPLLNPPITNCPKSITIEESNDPYYEGGYTLRGKADLSEISYGFVIASQDILSTTWTAVLKPEYANCEATGRIVALDGEEYNYHSHIRVRFLAGQLILTLDLTGLRDVNQYTPVLMETGVKDGIPTWTWAGID